MVTSEGIVVVECLKDTNDVYHQQIKQMGLVRKKKKKLKIKGDVQKLSSLYDLHELMVLQRR